MPVNDKIRVPDYNDIRSKVANVVGPGSGNSGWGQTLVSSAVVEGTTVSVNEWGKLRYDIINAWRHIYGSSPTTVLPALGNTVRYSNTFVPDTGASDAPITQYNTYADNIVANRFTVHSGQSATTSWPSGSSTWPGPYGSFWTAKIQCTITASWSNSSQARYFFNSGGEIRLSSSRSGGANSQQNTSWTNLLNSAGVRAFGGNLPIAGSSPATGTNFYRCTDTYQEWYTISGSTPYGGNSYRILARTPGIANNSTGSASSIQFLIEWIDNYVDPGVVPGSTAFPQGTPIGPGGAGGGVQTATPADFPPDDAVDGTFSVSVSHLYATGVLEPPGTGNFVVQQPTVTIGAIAP